MHYMPQITDTYNTRLTENIKKDLIANLKGKGIVISRVRIDIGLHNITISACVTEANAILRRSGSRSSLTCNSLL